MSQLLNRAVPRGIAGISSQRHNSVKMELLCHCEACPFALTNVRRSFQPGSIRDDYQSHSTREAFQKRRLRMKRIFSIMIVLVASVVAINFAMAATTTYTCKPMSDTRLDSATPTTNYGTATVLKMVGTGAGGPVRSIIRLNIPPFVSASQIQSAYLNVYGMSSGSASLAINIHPVTPPGLWFEKNL